MTTKHTVLIAHFAPIIIEPLAKIPARLIANWHLLSSHLPTIDQHEAHLISSISRGITIHRPIAVCSVKNNAHRRVMISCSQIEESANRAMNLLSVLWLCLASVLPLFVVRLRVPPLSSRVVISVIARQIIRCCAGTERKRVQWPLEPVLSCLQRELDSSHPVEELGQSQAQRPSKL